MVGFSAILDLVRQIGDETQINRWKGIVTRFKVKLVKMVKDVNSKM